MVLFLRSKPTHEELCERSLAEVRLIASYLQIPGVAKMSKQECESRMIGVWVEEPVMVESGDEGQMSFRPDGQSTPVPGGGELGGGDRVSVSASRVSVEQEGTVLAPPLPVGGRSPVQEPTP